MQPGGRGWRVWWGAWASIRRAAPPPPPPRDLKAYDRKVRKARAKANEKLARRLLAAKPGVRLDHLVRERWGAPLGRPGGAGGRGSQGGGGGPFRRWRAHGHQAA